jgi:hypothetical protein
MARNHPQQSEWRCQRDVLQRPIRVAETRLPEPAEHWLEASVPECRFCVLAKDGENLGDVFGADHIATHAKTEVIIPHTGLQGPAAFTRPGERVPYCKLCHVVPFLVLGECWGWRGADLVHRAGIRQGSYAARFSSERFARNSMISEAIRSDSASFWASLQRLRM